MTLKTLLKNIGEMAVKQKLVRYSAAGASLAEINPMEINWYPLFYAIPAGTHTISENIITFSLTLYYIDRLLEDNSNEVDIFSSSIENLRNIIIGISNLPGVYDVENNYTMNNFMPEKLNDRLCGSYATVRISVVADSVCYVEEGEEPVPPEPIDYSKEYLTIVPRENGGIYTNQTLEISRDGGETWETVQALPGGTYINLYEGKEVKLRGRTNNPTFVQDADLTKFDLYGNITSLMYGDGFTGQTALRTTLINTFQGLGVVDASNLFLGTELMDACFLAMFSGCRSLIAVPELPATGLTYSCYCIMFYNCTSLTKAQKTLPATTLADSCYIGMFAGCTNLIATPELPATELNSYCYDNMFSNCVKLSNVSALPATTLADSCYRSMFYGCVSITDAPELPADILVNSCYQYMFSGCTNLHYVKCLATSISANSCTNRWLLGVSQSGRFVKTRDMAGWTRGISGIPDGWAIVDA